MSAASGQSAPISPPHRGRPSPCPDGRMHTPPPAAHRHVVLVVDDDRDCAESLSELIRFSTDCQVEVACGSQEALSQAAAHSPDTVVMDPSMLDMDGFATAEKLRTTTPDRQTTFIALTGSDGLYEEASHDHRFKASLLKPVDTTQLIELIVTSAESH